MGHFGCRKPYKPINTFNMNEYFTHRKRCPCCSCRASNEIYRASYDQGPVRNYLDTFYSPQGGVEHKYLENQDFVVCECPECGLVYQREIPNDLVMHKLYDEWIDSVKVFEDVEKKRSVEYFLAMASEVTNIIRYFKALPSQLHFLDYSMGWGHWCRIAQSLGCNVHGTEFSTTRLEHVAKIGLITVDQNEMLRNRYDFINTEQVFEHLPKPKEVLLGFKRCLKPNGLLKISVPNGVNIKRKLEKCNWSASKGSSDSLNPIAPMEHLNCFSENTLIEFTKDVGLMPVNVNEIQPRDIAYKVKKILRPYYHVLKGRGTGFTDNENICLYFKLKN